MPRNHLWRAFWEAMQSHIAKGRVNCKRFMLKQNSKHLISSILFVPLSMKQTIFQYFYKEYFQPKHQEISWEGRSQDCLNLCKQWRYIKQATFAITSCGDGGDKGEGDRLWKGAWEEGIANLSLSQKRVLILCMVLMIDFAPMHDYHTLGSMFGMYQ